MWSFPFQGLVPYYRRRWIRFWLSTIPLCFVSLSWILKSGIMSVIEGCSFLFFSRRRVGRLTVGGADSPKVKDYMINRWRHFNEKEIIFFSICSIVYLLKAIPAGGCGVESKNKKQGGRKKSRVVEDGLAHSTWELFVYWWSIHI